jgi:hypothetical protein
MGALAGSATLTRVVAIRWPGYVTEEIPRLRRVEIRS